MLTWTAENHGLDCELWRFLCPFVLGAHLVHIFWNNPSASMNYVEGCKQWNIIQELTTFVASTYLLNMSILSALFHRGGLSSHDKTTCFSNVDASKYLLQWRYVDDARMICSWSWCMPDAVRLEWSFFVVYDCLNCASTLRNPGQHWRPQPFDNIWFAFQQWP